MERENNKLKFTLVWSSCICVLLLMVVLGISSSAKGTMAASCTSDTCTCPNGSYPNLSGDYCWGKFEEKQTGSEVVECAQVNDGSWRCLISAIIKDTDDSGSDGDTTGGNQNVSVDLVGNGGAVNGHTYITLACNSDTWVCILPSADNHDIPFLGWSVGSASCGSLVNGTYKTSVASGTKLYACWDEPDYAWFWTPAEGPEACLPYKEYFGKSGYSYIRSASSCSITKYTISYASGGGSGSMSSDSVNEGDDYTIKSNSFTKSCYSFTGWSGSDGKSYSAGATISNVSSDITLTAQWGNYSCGNTNPGTGGSGGETTTPPSSDPEPSSEPSSEPSVSDPSDEEISSRPSSDNVETNPPTGDIAIFVVWVLAAAAIVYSVWYFKQVREN